MATAMERPDLFDFEEIARWSRTLGISKTVHLTMFLAHTWLGAKLPRPWPATLPPGSARVAGEIQELMEKNPSFPPERAWRPRWRRLWLICDRKRDVLPVVWEDLTSPRYRDWIYWKVPLSLYPTLVIFHIVHSLYHWARNALGLRRRPAPKKPKGMVP
jgi:hypothetical protein